MENFHEKREEVVGFFDFLSATCFVCRGSEDYVRHSSSLPNDSEGGTHPYRQGQNHL